MICDGSNIGAAMPPKSSCLEADGFREQAYANFYSVRALNSFIELSLDSDPLRNDLYSLQSLVCNPSAVPIISVARREAYENALAKFETVAPVVNAQRVGVYAAAPTELHGSARHVEASTSGVHAKVNASGVYKALANHTETGSEVFKSALNSNKESIYATLPSNFHDRRAAQSPPRAPTNERVTAYSILPSQAQTPSSPTASPRSIRKMHTYATNMAIRPGVATSHANLPLAASAAESRTAKAHNYDIFNESTLESSDVAPTPRTTSVGTRVRSATYTVRTADAASSSLHSVAPSTVPKRPLVPRTSPSSAQPSKRSSPMASVSMENLPAVATRTSRTPSIIRAGSSKNLFALGSSGSLLTSFIDESALEKDFAESLGTAPGTMSAPVSPVTRSKLTRVGHLGSIAQLQKFAC